MSHSKAQVKTTQQPVHPSRQRKLILAVVAVTGERVDAHGLKQANLVVVAQHAYADSG